MHYLDWSSNMVKEIEHDEMSEAAESGKMHNITSKAGRLAMELAAEKKRLAQELEELQGEYDDIKPLTPTGTRDWYVKWSSMILGVMGVFLISAEVYLFGQLAYLISAIGWIYVGMQWGDQSHYDWFCDKCYCCRNVFNRKPFAL